MAREESRCEPLVVLESPHAVGPELDGCTPLPEGV